MILIPLIFYETNTKEYFTVEEKTVNQQENELEISKKIKEDLETKSDHKFALYYKGKYLILTLKDELSMDKFAKDRSKTWRTLDVSILHKMILDQLMGINQDNLEDHV